MAGGICPCRPLRMKCSAGNALGGKLLSAGLAGEQAPPTARAGCRPGWASSKSAADVAQPTLGEELP